MSCRTTNKELESIIASINKHFGFEGKQLWNRINDHNVATVGMFYLYQGYQSYGLARMINEAGAVNMVFDGCSKSELAGKMRAFLLGLTY